MTTRLTAATLKGNWATLLLPVNDDNSINEDLLADEIDRLIAIGVDGIYSNGTAGEFFNQTEKEFERINGLLAEKCSKAGMRFQVGASQPSPILSLERVKKSVALKPDAIQVILPDWVVTNSEERVHFMEQIADAANGTPLVLYNPPHARTVLTPWELMVLREAVPQLIGIKVMSGDEQWVADIKQFAADLSVFVPGHMLATGVSNGIASGAYSNVACINPGAAQKWWAQMQSDLEAALELEQRIRKFFRECIVPFQQKGYSNPALDKFLAAVGGYIHIGTRLRWPYQFIAASEVLPVRARAKELIPEFFN